MFPRFVIVFPEEVKKRALHDEGYCLLKWNAAANLKGEMNSHTCCSCVEGKSYNTFVNLWK